MSDGPILFDLRRMEMLSNTIFGVAMTLTAYALPRGGVVKGVPDFKAIWAAYHVPLTSMLITFVVAGLFWLGHVRRIAYAPDATRTVTLLNLVFLLTVMLLPVASGLYGAYGADGDVATVYCGLLALCSVVHTSLWLMASVPRGEIWMALGPAYAGVMFLLAAILAPFAPVLPQYLLAAALATPFVDHVGTRKAWQARQAGSAS